MADVPTWRTRGNAVGHFFMDILEDAVERIRGNVNEHQAEAWDAGRRAQAEYQKLLGAAPNGNDVPEPVNPWRVEQDDDRR